MAKSRHVVHGVTVDLRVLAEGMYEVLHHVDVLGSVTYRTVHGSSLWTCSACDYPVARLPAILAHLVADHAHLSHRPLPSRLASGMVAEASFAAQTTYLRLVGKHPDPTPEQAHRNITGRAW
ncbi:MAG: hypothetical protein H0U76_27975 [Ktedonobacteraceae bacterium]|nr:hypothetical protein [Ktedonobacteraceae bacterium]MBA3824701.1 hypothetical protein [Ktedonobacterales bacterium]